jgi:hypothetical protein|tara:strand:+ start:387 stop:512 length:126 start_codon:yes stop_codon:yes gene_type:complete
MNFAHIEDIGTNDTGEDGENIKLLSLTACILLFSQLTISKK